MAQPQQLSEEEYYHKTDNLIRLSCQSLQALFRHKWKKLTGNDWSTAAGAAPSSQTFINGIGKQVYTNSGPAQKSLIQQGCLEEWDISLLSKVLLVVFKSRKPNLVSKTEATAIRNLTHLRNQVAHNALKKVSLSEYEQFENSFKDNLISLGLREDEITKLINQPGITSDASTLEQAARLHSKGDQEFSQERYKEAIGFYNDALTLPNLLPVDQGRIYEKRAASYLALLSKNGNGVSGSGGGDGYLDQAQKDAETAMKLNESSWKAHELMGRVLKEKGGLDGAIQHFTRALAISPGETRVREILNATKLLEGIIEREEHLDPRKMPMNLAERVQHFTDETGKPMTEEMFLKISSMMSDIVVGQADVATGHQYLMGWNVEQDATQAARYYAKAAEAGNAEGIFNLASLLKSGKAGVKQDIPYALELLRKAAAMPPIITTGDGTQLKDAGVYGAQHSLGLMYQEGVGVPQSSSEAARWYKKAADNGCGNAANNLAIMYSTGEGVEQRNDKLAVQYWKLAVEAKNHSAAKFLYNYYVDNMEPSMARRMFETAIELGDQKIASKRRVVIQSLEQLQQRRKSLEGPLLEFEKKHGLGIRGLTFLERQERLVAATISSPETSSVIEVMRELNVAGGFGSNPPTKWPGQAGAIIDSQEILQKSLRGSKTARNIMETQIANDQFIELWGRGPPALSDSLQINRLIDTLYTGYCLESHIFGLPQEMYPELASFLEAALSQHGTERSELDKKIRFCYAIACGSRSNHYDYSIQVGLEGMKRYPDEVHFYQAVSNKYGKAKKYKLGLEVVRKGLQRFPGNVELLYSAAVHLRLSKEGTREDCREAYSKFIRSAPRDHRKLPEAHYSVAQSYYYHHDSNSESFIGSKHNEEPSWKIMMLEKMKYHYELGKEAEAVQLSCHLPYYSSAKLYVELELNIQKGDCETLKSDYEQPPPPPPTTTVSSVSHHKLHLQDPRRIEIIKRHRDNLHRAFNNSRSSVKDDPNIMFRITTTTVQPKLVQRLPNKPLSELRKITLEEMMPPIKDVVYDSRILSLTIIDEPLLGLPSVHLVAEDENGEVARLYVYNVHQNKEDALKGLRFGCRLAIMNPYMRIAAMDLSWGVRVDDPKTIIYGDDIGVEKNMCRYCGEENAQHTCSKCKFARYCSRSCQVSDWKILNHKLICNATG